jgi:hypothetical protein
VCQGLESAASHGLTGMVFLNWRQGYGQLEILANNVLSKYLGHMNRRQVAPYHLFKSLPVNNISIFLTAETVFFTAVMNSKIRVVAYTHELLIMGHSTERAWTLCYEEFD